MFFFSICSFLGAQNKYLDWDLKEISAEVFRIKMNSGRYASTRVSVDTNFRFFKLKRKEVFGKLDSLTTHQLRLALLKSQGVETNKTLFIHYLDTLPLVGAMPARDTVIIEQKLDKNGRPYTSHTHLHSFHTEAKGLRREIEFMKQFKEVEFFHLVNVFSDYPVWVEGHKMMEDPMKTFRKVFSDGLTPYNNIILYSDGTFLMTTYKLTSSQIKKLLNRKNFDKQRKKWKFQQGL